MIYEFKPVIFFLVKFLSIYFVGNILYGLWVNSYEPLPDPATHAVTVQTSWLLNISGWDTTVSDNPDAPTTNIVYESRPIIAVFEGCNGVNVFIIFISFLFAFGPWVKPLIWFSVSGLLVIHIANLLRVGLLFLVSLNFPDAFYFIHKYIFTAFIYVVVFILWVVWVKKIAIKFRSGEA